MATKNKPLGIILIALYSGVGGLISLPAGCTATLGVGVPGLGLRFALLAATAFAIGIFLFASAYGLWTSQSWALKLTFWAYAASIPLGVLAIVAPLGGRSSQGNTFFQLIGIGLDVVIILYLSRPGIAGPFEPTRPSTETPEWARNEPKF